MRSAAVEFVATAAAQLSPAEVYALLLPVVAPALVGNPASLADPQVSFQQCTLVSFSSVTSGHVTTLTSMSCFKIRAAHLRDADEFPGLTL